MYIGNAISSKVGDFLFSSIHDYVIHEYINVKNFTRM